MVIERSESCVNLPDNMGRTPLYIAAQSGQCDSVECLLKLGADPNAQAIGPSELGQTPLHAAISGGFAEIVQNLIDGGARLNIQDSEGNTALHLACEKRDPKVLKVLQHKCTVGELRNVNSNNETPLHVLLSIHQDGFIEELKEIARNISKYYTLQVQNNNGVCALHLAAFWNLELPVKVMLFNRIRATVKDKHGWTPLHYCFLNERGISIETAKYLVSNNSHPMIGDNFGKSPLHFLMNHAHSAEPSVLEMVREWNAANAKTSVGKPLLHLAVIDGNIAIAKLLVACEVDVNLKDRNGSTALHLAAAGGKTEILRLLIAHGAKVNILDGRNMTALHHAAMLNQSAAVQMLLHHRAKMNDFDEDGQTPIHRASGWGSLDVLRYLVDYGARFGQLDFKGQNALHVAASEGKMDNVKFLISRGLDVTEVDKSGKTALHLAIKPANLDIIETLLERGVDVNVQDKQGQNALHLACFYGNMDVINTLLQHGANDKTRDQSDRTPEDVGREIGQQTAMDMMVEMAKAGKEPPLETTTESNAGQLEQDVAAYRQEILASVEQDAGSLEKRPEPKRRAVEAELEDFLKRGKVRDGHYRPDSFAEAEEGLPMRIEVMEVEIEQTDVPDVQSAPERSPVREDPSPNGGRPSLETLDETEEEKEKEEPEVQLPDCKPEKKKKTPKCCIIM